VHACLTGCLAVCICESVRLTKLSLAWPGLAAAWQVDNCGLHNDMDRYAKLMNETGRETPLFAPLYTKNDHFAKTGGTNIGKTPKKVAFPQARLSLWSDLTKATGRRPTSRGAHVRETLLQRNATQRKSSVGGLSLAWLVNITCLVTHE
jgi:hypothetical protein